MYQVSNGVTSCHMRERTSTLMYPNNDSVGLSIMFVILYSKFCAATRQQLTE